MEYPQLFQQLIGILLAGGHEHAPAGPLSSSTVPSAEKERERAAPEASQPGRAGIKQGAGLVEFIAKQIVLKKGAAHFLSNATASVSSNSFSVLRAASCSASFFAWPAPIA